MRLIIMIIDYETIHRQKSQKLYYHITQISGLVRDTNGTSAYHFRHTTSTKLFLYSYLIYLLFSSVMESQCCVGTFLLVLKWVSTPYNL